MFRKRRRISFYQKKKTITPRVVREIMAWVCITFIAIFAALLFVSGFGMQVRNIGDSMSPTISSGQTLLVNRLVFKILRPKEGDIIVFLPNGNTNSHFYVKRVVAVPGDRVQIVDGSLYVNGEIKTDRNDLYDKMEDAGIAANEIKLQSGEYFVLGDNRNISEDSRSANIGIVSNQMIIGKVWFKLKTAEAGGGLIL